MNRKNVERCRDCSTPHTRKRCETGVNVKGSAEGAQAFLGERFDADHHACHPQPLQNVEKGVCDGCGIDHQAPRGPRDGPVLQRHHQPLGPRAGIGTGSSHDIVIDEVKDAYSPLVEQLADLVRNIFGPRRLRPLTPARSSSLP